MAVKFEFGHVGINAQSPEEGEKMKNFFTEEGEEQKFTNQTRQSFMSLQMGILESLKIKS